MHLHAHMNYCIMSLTRDLFLIFEMQEKLHYNEC
jgi:hypothetical protein